MSVVAAYVLAAVLGALLSLAGPGPARAPFYLASLGTVALIVLSYTGLGLSSWQVLGLAGVLLGTLALTSGYAYRNSPTLAGHGYWGRVGYLLTNGGRVREADEQHDLASKD